MRAKRIAATAVLAIGAVGVTAGVVQAQPAPAAEAAISGADHGVAYVAAPTADRTGVTTTVAAGTFALTQDGQAVTLTDVAGNEVARVPLTVPVAGGAVGLTPRIDAAGRSLTLTANDHTAQVAQNIDEASDTEARKQHNAGVGALIGAGIGAVIGFFLGGVGALVTVPIGAGIGALIGYSTP
ncbi:hypothetical protein BJY24_007396 [Nocardia transvalensis]|uniref:DUF8020 domain-containing protein n=1 Tax=Nocardia transvalensis TaxID=37333 RepID=A0A7W9UMC8_9NOCA|nr:hypothetical protein [Nocardia transvalensis]MBB5918484.1 hypothetical protein [Nocardia transvalensis]